MRVLYSFTMLNPNVIKINTIKVVCDINFRIFASYEKGKNMK